MNGSAGHFRRSSTRLGGRFSPGSKREESASVSVLAQPFVIKLPAVMKHLDVLDDAGLITRTKVGRTVTVQLRPEPIREAMDWLRRYERFWSMSLDRLTAYAEGKEAEVRKKRR